MKYISRLTALLLALLALLMLLSCAGAEMAIDDLTEGQLNALYTSTGEDTYINWDGGVLGASAELTAFSDVTDKTGYTFQWYDADGNAVAATSDSAPYTLAVTYTLAEQSFYCIATDADGAQYKSEVNVVGAAQTTVMDDYLNYLYDDKFYDADGNRSFAATYQMMFTTWNVTVEGGNLAQLICEAWYAEKEESWFDDSLFCSCVITGAATADFCMLAPGAEHIGTCGWYTTTRVLQDETTGITVTGDIPADVTLKVTGATGDVPELNIAHMDITAISPMVRSHNISLLDESGDEYVVPEGTVLQVNIPDVYRADLVNPVVDVYHVKADGTVEYLTSGESEVTLLADFSISFETDGFSDFVIVVGSQTIGALGNGAEISVDIAPGAALRVGYYWQENKGCESNDESAARVAYSANYYTISVPDDAEIGATAVVTLRFKDHEGEKTATINVTVIKEEKPSTMTDTDTLYGDNYTCWQGNGGIFQYYMVSGTKAHSNGYGSDAQVESSDANVATALLDGENLYITAVATAQVGDSAKITVKRNGMTFSVIYVDIIGPLTPSEKLDSEYYPVQLAIRNSGILPNEPWVYGSSSYTYFCRTVEDDGDVWHWIGTSGDIIGSTAAGIIDPTIIRHEDFKLIYPDGAKVIGLVDPTGKVIEQYLSAINWDNLLDKVVEANADLTDDQPAIYAYDNVLVTAENKSEFKVIPYVVKCQDGNGQGWHIDCAVVRADAVILSYDINIPDGMVTTTQNIAMPNNETGAPGSTFGVGRIMSTASEPSVALEVIQVAPNYEFTFLGWNTKADGSGTMYQPGSDITINEDTTLYAIWSITPEIGTGNLRIRKVVSGEAEENESFTFEIEIPEKEGEADKTYEYVLYGADNVAVKDAEGKATTGTVQNGSTFTLADGQYVIISGLPIAEKAEGSDAYTPNITVTELNAGDYTPAWTGGSASGASVSVAVLDGRLSEVVCTNTKGGATATLTVTKSGMANGESAIFEVKLSTGTFMVVLNGTKTSEKILNVPIGSEYTVTEKNDWSWRYEADENPKTGTIVAGENLVEFNNTRKTSQWLGDESWVENDATNGEQTGNLNNQ